MTTKGHHAEPGAWARSWCAIYHCISATDQIFHSKSTREHKKEREPPPKKNSTLLQVKAFCLTSGFLLLFAEPEEGINVLPQLEIEFKKKKGFHVKENDYFFFYFFFQNYSLNFTQICEHFFNEHKQHFLDR